MTLKWGVLGVAKIATQKVIPAMQRGQFTEVAAVASRDEARAKAAARALGIPRAYGSYDELLADAEIQAVYIPLPNHLHVPWTIRAAAAGKHVLCEKPIALSAAEARGLLEVRARTGVHIQEAFMVRTHPQWTTARDLVRSGRIGALRSVLGYFSYFNDDPADIRNIPAFGGGALLDIGCYLINTARFIVEREPRRVSGTIDRDPVFGIDRTTSLLLDFGTSHAAGTCSTQTSPFQRVQIVGTSGRIEIEIPFNAPPDRPCRVLVETGGATDLVDLPVCDQYTIQADRFSQAVLGGHVPATSVQDAVSNMACIDAVFRSAASGRWERPVFD